MLHDLRYALRTLRRSPGFTVSAVIALALGIGANTAVFSVVYAVLLKPLPYSEGNRLVRLSETNPARPGDEAIVSSGTFTDLRTRSRALGSMAVYAPLFNGETIWDLGGHSTIVKTVGASPSLFSVLRVSPVIGGSLRPETETPPAGAMGQFVISYGLWQRAFGGDPRVVGRTVMLEGRLPRQIVGVMPPGFDFPDGTDAWTSVPLVSVAAKARRARSYEVIGRLAPGVSLAAARRELSGLSTQLAAESPASNRGWSTTAAPLRDSHAGAARLALLVLMAAVAGVLLIGCANVANLLLARATARRAEMAVRLALGASRGRLIRQSLAETLVLSTAGAGVGLLGGIWLGRVLAGLAPADIAPHRPPELDPTVLAFTVAVSLVCVALAGLVPAIQASRDAGGAGLGPGRAGLRVDVRGATSRSARTRRVVVGAEAAIVVLLLTVATLSLRTFVNVRHVDLGFDAARAIEVEMRWPVGAVFQAAPGTKPWPRVRRAVDGLVAAVNSVPGVAAAGLMTDIPLTGDPSNGRVWRADAPGAHDLNQPTDPRDRWQTDLAVVTPGYFPAIGIPILRGRNFTDGDRFDDDVLNHRAPSRLGAAVVNSAFAARYFAGQDPLGRNIVLEDDAEFGGIRTIVGVSADIRQRSIEEAPRPTVYIPHDQHPDVVRPSLVVRTRLPTSAVAAALRQRIASYDPQIVIVRMRPMTDVVSAAMSQPRFNLLLIGSFALLAVLLAAVGVYGVLAYLVSARTREIGIRMALGARAADVRRLIFIEGLSPVAVGLVVGVLAAISLTRLARTLLYGVSPLDPISLTAAPAILALVAIAACYFPARRATRVDPLVALRDE